MSIRYTCNQCGDRFPDGPRDGSARLGYCCRRCYTELGFQ